MERPELRDGRRGRSKDNYKQEVGSKNQPWPAMELWLRRQIIFSHTTYRFFRGEVEMYVEGKSTFVRVLIELQ